MKAVLVDSQLLPAYSFQTEQKIFDNAGIVFEKASCKDEDELIQRYGDADAILNIYMKITAKSIKALQNCRVLVRYGIGYDAFDVEAATEKGIMVCNIPSYCIPEVATHTTALILNATRQLLHFSMAMRSGKWDSDKGKIMRRPQSQVVGLLGFGSIAQETSRQLKAVGYSIMAYDPYQSDSAFSEAGVKKADIDTVFQNADIISVHVPLNKDTYHLIDNEAFEKMKEGVVIVNTARGPIISEDALISALISGKVGAAGLDVFENEPFNNPNHPFCTMNNVILSPHAAYNSAESFVSLCESVAQTAVDALNGKTPLNIVNKKELQNK